MSLFCLVITNSSITVFTMRTHSVKSECTFIPFWAIVIQQIQLEQKLFWFFFICWVSDFTSKLEGHLVTFIHMFSYFSSWPTWSEIKLWRKQGIIIIIIVIVSVSQFWTSLQFGLDQVMKYSGADCVALCSLIPLGLWMIY